MVSDSLSAEEYLKDSGVHISYADVFYAKFPYYLSIGMTEEQYWDNDSTLVKYYREADELRKERTNYEMWLQGMYIYDTIARLSPILHAFAKKGTTAEPYPDEPYPINEKSRKDMELKQERQNLQRGLQYMQMYMVQSNEHFKEGR